MILEKHRENIKKINQIKILFEGSLWLNRETHFIQIKIILL